MNGLHLCEAAIHKQFRSRDVAAVVGGEKHHSLGDLIGCPEPAERNAIGNHLLTLLAHFCRSQQLTQSGRVDGAWAHRVHANAASLQVRCPCPRKRTDRGFGGAIHTPVGQPFTGNDGRIQDDRRTVRHERKRLLPREQEAFHIDVEDRVIVLLGYLAEGGKLRPTGIREDNVEPALLPLDLREEAIEIYKARHVSLYAGHIYSDLLDRRSQLPFTAARDEDVRAFVHTLLRRRQANAAIATSNEGNFAFKFVHVFLSSHQSLSYCEDDPAEGAALNQVTQSISRFGQREGLSHDRFDRAGLKQRDESIPGVSPGRLRLSEQYEALDAGPLPDQIGDVNGGLATCRIPQCCEASVQRQRSERLRLLGFRMIGRAGDGVFCAQGTRQLCHRVADRSADRRCQHGFACLKTSEGERHLRGKIRDRHPCGAHVVDTLGYQAQAFLPYGKPLTVGSILKNAIRPSEHHTCTDRQVRSASFLHHARSFAAED